MSGVSRWRESGNLERAVENAGGPEAFAAAVSAMLDEARGWRLAEMRKRRGMTQEQVAARMGVSVARVSQIESGDVSGLVRPRAQGLKLERGACAGPGPQG